MKLKPRTVAALLAAALAGCSTPPERQVWDVKPAVDIRHGMAEAKAYFQMGRYQQMQGRDVTAEDMYRRALAADPRNLDVLNALASLYAERGQFDLAAEMYRRIAEQGPPRAYLFNNIGYAYYLQGRYAEAAEALRTAVTLDANYERAWVNLERTARKGEMPELLALAVARRLQPAPVVLAKEEAPGAASLAGSSEAIGPVAATAVIPEQPVVAETGLIANSVPRPSEAERLVLPTVDGGGQSTATQAAVLSPAAGTVPVEVVGNTGSAATVSVDEPVRLAEASLTPEASVVPKATPSAPPTLPEMPKARLEVANGNGVTGDASRARALLRSDGLNVARIFNYSTYSVRQTFIEYQSGYADAARVLRDRLGRQFALKEVKRGKIVLDVRLVLGADWGKAKPVLSEAEPEPATAAQG